MESISTPSPTPVPPLLELCGISKRYANGTLANDGVSFAVQQGEIHAIVGENGAGKSTVMKMLYGLEQPSAGDILLDGAPVRFRHPREAIKAGIGLVPQHVQLVPSFTVTQNIALGCEPSHGMLVDYRRCVDEVGDMSRHFGMEVDPHAVVGELSLGEQQRVGILKTLYRKARIVLLDEPTAVLTSQETATLFYALRRLTARGVTAILITHKLSEVRQVCDRFTVMRAGRVTGQGQARDANDAAMTDMIVGRQVPPLRIAKIRKKELQPLVAARDLSLVNADDRRLLAHVSFDIAAGEILGIAGVEGNGQTALAEILGGLHEPTAGKAELDGETFTGKGVRAARAARVAVIPEDRLHNGVALDMSLTENLIAADYHKPPYSRMGCLQMETATEATHRAIDTYGVVAHSPAAAIASLSGGNMQKIVLAREVSSAPRFLVASQPTRGVDIGAAQALRQHLVDLRDRGAAILLISADLDEVLELSDRIAVMFNGEIVAHFAADRVSAHELGLYMTGLQRQDGAAALLASAWTPEAMEARA